MQQTLMSAPVRIRFSYRLFSVNQKDGAERCYQHQASQKVEIGNTSE